LSVATSASAIDIGPDDEIEQHRREITRYCYRMLGTVFDADDAAQETMVRAWRSRDGFEGRSSLRTWLFRIATNICLDALRGQQRRARPMDLGPSSPAELAFLGPMDFDQPWVLPMPDARCFADGDPEATTLERESIQLAFVAALQHLPARQRAVLILADVLRWPATEVAQLLDTTVASVNSALQRARATLEARHLEAHPRPDALGPDERLLLDQFVDAFEQYDVSRLATLLRDDVIQSMPPFAMWLEGPDRIADWMLGPGLDCQGSRLLATSANGGAAFGQYRRAETFGPTDEQTDGRTDGRTAGGHLPWALQVIEVSDGAISGIHSFLDPTLFAAFDLPPRLEP
jgi:RNA polymerase sigma-70 factor (ECF subfamily)